MIPTRATHIKKRNFTSMYWLIRTCSPAKYVSRNMLKLIDNRYKLGYVSSSIQRLTTTNPRVCNVTRIRVWATTSLPRRADLLGSKTATVFQSLSCLLVEILYHVVTLLNLRVPATRSSIEGRDAALHRSCRCTWAQICYRLCTVLGSRRWKLHAVNLRDDVPPAHTTLIYNLGKIIVCQAVNTQEAPRVAYQQRLVSG